MDTTDQATRDQEALNARRERLRALPSRIAETVEALPPPETWLQATRSARSIGLAARIIARFPDEDASKDQPLRERLRAAGDRLMDTTESLPMPDSHLEGERAARFTLAAERMLEQLYAPPSAPKPAKQAKARVATPEAPRPAKAEKPAPPPPPEPRLPRGFASWDEHRAWENAQVETPAERTAAIKYKIDRSFRAKARNSGRWHDGTPYNPAFPNYGCDYIYFRVEGFDPELALHPHERSEPWQVEAVKGPWPEHRRSG